MPNWCENFMRLEVPNKQEADIIDAVLDENKQVYEEFRKNYIPKGCGGMPFWGDEPLGLLGYLMPEPDYKEGDEKLAKDGINHTFPDWYSWRTSNWGTKWEVSIEHRDRLDNEDGTVTFEFNFDSAWSPPTGVYDTVSQRDGWDVFATYIEGGMDFMGYFEDGEDNSYQAGTRTTTDAPDWLVDEFSWHYDYQDECEQESDSDLVVRGEMTHQQFIDKWGNDVYDNWKDLLTPGTGDPAKKATENV
mgnify:FL=1|tara:strand:+ start:1310 stop:2047 length:738 start_codon:yes stop_codon:yes gene_type:complete